MRQKNGEHLSQTSPLRDSPHHAVRGGSSPGRYGFTLALAMIAGLTGCSSPSRPEKKARTYEPADVVLIPAGTFRMGDPFDEGDPDERPVHTVHIDAFYMDQYEVTNSQYTFFCDATGKSYPPELFVISGYFEDYPDHPVVNVTWYDAVRYCNWRSLQEGLEPVYDETSWEADFTKDGYRLPTEAEWEYAARGGEGKRYPWGDEDPSSRANYWYYVGPLIARMPDIHGGRGPLPVGSFPANGYGLYDMAGNVWEWCNDWYDEGYYSVSPSDNPGGPSGGSLRVRRGGSWINDAIHIRCANRGAQAPATKGNGVGFRCVRRP